MKRPAAGGEAAGDGRGGAGRRFAVVEDLVLVLRRELTETSDLAEYGPGSIFGSG
jgi:hypothetical protein